MIGPLVVSKTVYGSTRAVSWMKSRSAGPTSAAVARWRLLTPTLPSTAKSRTRWSALRATMSQGRWIHSPPSSRPRSLAASSSNQTPTPLGSSATACSGPTSAQRGLAVAECQPGPPVARRLEPGGGNPAAVGHQHRPPRQPAPVVDRGVRVPHLLDRRQVRPDHHAPAIRARSDPEGPRDLAAERAGPQEQIEHRASQRQRLKTGDRVVFDQAESHCSLRFRSCSHREDTRKFTIRILETSVATGCRYDATGRWTSITRKTCQTGSVLPAVTHDRFVICKNCKKSVPRSRSATVHTAARWRAPGLIRRIDPSRSSTRRCVWPNNR